MSQGYEFGVALSAQCLDELAMLTGKERKLYLLEKVRGCVLGKSEKGYLKMNYTIGVSPGLQLTGVCRKCFCNAYGVGGTFLDDLCSRLKAGDRAVAEELSDDTPAPHSVFIKSLLALADSRGVCLSESQLGALMVPNTVPSLTCFAWMKSFFDAVGDQQPNCSQIHLEPTNVKTVHAEYVQVIGDAGEETLSYESFLNMWSCCFNHVKIREYKAVSGKCSICTLLSESRRKQLSTAARRYITELHALHRTLYMGERLEYYKRRNNAMLMPSEYWSAIGDGMQQHHCVLPHRGNMSVFPKTLPQHLQGMLVHGRSVEIYRTFHVCIVLFCILICSRVVYSERSSRFQFKHSLSVARA